MGTEARLPRWRARSPPLRRRHPLVEPEGAKDQVIERFEQKYVIHPALVPKIPGILRPFCIPDPNGKGEIPN
ncbi:MAG: hypothetical protein R3F11_08000 [Verrucomicrobiales bacterium]